MGMIVDKLNLLLNTKAAIKTAITEKGQPVADEDPFSSYPAKIAAIETGVQLPALTNPGTAADLLEGKQLIDAEGNALTGTMPEVEQATPAITVSSTGLITASAAQGAGYVAAGEKSATKQLTTKAAATITPGTANQTIAAGTYLTGTQTIKGDANLLAENIKSGIDIFGIGGTYGGKTLVYESFVFNPYNAGLQSDYNTFSVTASNQISELLYCVVMSNYPRSLSALDSSKRYVLSLFNVSNDNLIIDTGLNLQGITVTGVTGAINVSTNGTIGAVTYTGNTITFRGDMYSPTAWFIANEAAGWYTVYMWVAYYVD